MFLTNVSKHLLVVPPGVFFLSFSKWYVVGDTANSSIGLRILLGHLDRDTDWHRGDAAGPIKFDMPCANILLGFLHGVKPDSESDPPQMQNPAANANARMCKIFMEDDKRPAIAAKESFFAPAATLR